MALKRSKTGQLAKIDALESQKQELLDTNRRLEHQMIMITALKVRHEAQDVETMKTVADTKVELANTKETLRVLEDQRQQIYWQCVFLHRGS